MPTKTRLSVDKSKASPAKSQNQAVDWEALLARIPGGKSVVNYEADSSRVNYFMNKFKKLGFISYNGGLTVNSGLLSVLLAHDMSELTK